VKLTNFIKQLQKLEAAGHGELDVFYRHGASGDCGELSSARVTDEVTAEGPFDLAEGASYISVYAGN
jgi:hypothetical protein